MRYSVVFVVVLVFSLSCTRGISKNEVFKNDKIEAGIRANMKAMNLQIFGYMKENNFEPLSQLFSDSLTSKLSSGFENKFLPQIQKVIRGHEFKVIDEFYVRTAKASDTIKTDGGKGDYAYNLQFPTTQQENYISLLVAGDSLNEVMLTFVYGKINGKWKLNMVMGEDYSLNKKNAIDQYKYAIKIMETNDLIDAANIMSLASHCMSPGGGIFQYKNAEMMGKFSDSLSKKVQGRYPFPYTVKELAGNPIIFNIHYEVMNKKFIPMIMYTTKINVADTVQLAAENKEMQQKIGAIFSGIDVNNNSLLYRAYNEIPSERNGSRYYGYIQNFR